MLLRSLISLPCCRCCSMRSASWRESAPLLFALTLWTAWAAFRRKLGTDSIAAQKWLLRAWVAAIPLGYIAVDMGWITREVGRQPWIIYGLLRTSDAVSNLPVSGVRFPAVRAVPHRFAATGQLYCSCSPHRLAEAQILAVCRYRGAGRAS